MRGDDGREERGDQHAVDDAASVEAGDGAGERVVEVDGVAVAGHLGVPDHIRLREPPRFPEHVADAEQTRRSFRGGGEGRAERGETRKRGEDPDQADELHRRG